MKDKLIECFQDTIKLINSNSNLLNLTKQAMKSTSIINEKVNIESYSNNKKGVITVCKDTTFNAAKPYSNAEKKVAVLNFASAVNPCGGVTIGAKAQEECLCRSSNLAPCLKQQYLMKEYYMPHRIAQDPMCSDKLIYTEGVTVFKDDSEVPQLMPEDEWFNVDVITCAAPNISHIENVDEDELSNVFISRIKAILNAAIKNNTEVIILGAFGCGAFKNPPQLVAEVFKKVLVDEEYKNYFEEVVFAIKKSSDDNFAIFNNVFADTDSVQSIELPNGVVLTESEDIDDFLSEQETNKYFGKKFSILGDSISTLHGFLPDGYKAFYENEACEKSRVSDFSDTWWGKVISYYSGKLISNSSYSGSKVTSENEEFPAGCSDKRIEDLSSKGINPDVVIIYLGFNDWANGVDVRSNSDNLKLSSCCFYFAYNQILSKIKERYPNAEVLCCTLNPTYMSSKSSFEFSFARAGIHIEEYNNCIRDSAKTHDCNLVDLYKYGLANDTIDGSHPNSDGMKTLATLLCSEIENSDKLIRDAPGKYVENNSLFKYVPLLLETEEKSDKKFCLYCNAEINPEDKFCMKCGKQVVTESDSIDVGDNDNVVEENSTICSNCGTKINVNDKFCLMCGKKVIADNDLDNNEKAEDDSKQEDNEFTEIIGDRYKLIRQVGKGASSIVYLAQDIKLERICAVKMIKKDTYANTIAAQESLDEANKMKLLAHISIPQLYDIYDDDEKLCIVLEFIEGKNLSEIIKSLNKPLDEYTVVSWAKQLCRVLFYLHTLKPPRIFRDLKPANIILQPNGVIKLIDFGTMKNYDESRAEDTVNLGTKGYAAPEQFGGRGQTDARTDIYGLGMTMYHLITGISPALPPFEFRPIRYYRKDISKGLENIVMKCIKVEREERYQSAMDLLNDLEKINL